MSRKTPPPKGSFRPAYDNATFRDLVLFEERLKTNAAILRRRKSRYQLYLTWIVAVVLYLSVEVFFQTSFMDVPYRYLLHKTFPDVYRDTTDVRLHPYIAPGLLLVALTTLMLFFASGLYAEKIVYANRYVPHANRALRNFNMYLNVRHRPLRSQLSRLFLQPLSFFSDRTASEGVYPPPRRTPSPERRPRRGTSVPIHQIPPTNNPRGELMFSSRVDRNFREGYERVRAAFERKRAQHAAAQAWYSWHHWPWNWGRGSGQPPTSANRGHSPSHSITSRGRATDTESAGSTPNSSRRPSPVPGSLVGANYGAGSRSGSPPRGVPLRLMPDRTRNESFSYLLSGDQSGR